MYVPAYVNGKEDEKWIRVEVAGRTAAPPMACKDAKIQDIGPYLPGDSVKTKYPAIGSPAAESLFKQLWRETNYAPDVNVQMRRERAGFITYEYGVYGFVPANPKFVSSCEVGNWEVPPPTTVAFVHTHPASIGQDLTQQCGIKKAYDATIDAADMGVLLYYKNHGFPDLYFIILDADGIRIRRPAGFDDAVQPRCGY
jgi:hypothetical protein